MPEGDSIVRIAAAMRPVLLGKQLREVRAGGVVHHALAGQTVVAIDTVGKHLLITTDRGAVIRSHLGMNGRWRRFPAGAAPSPAASLALATPDDVLVCTRAMQIEIRDRRDPRLGASIARLGPDVLGATLDLTAVLGRARALPTGTPAASMLLDQRVACGIGNIYKCESLFLEGVSPWTPVERLDDARITGLFERARALMQQNLGPGKRRTRGASNDDRYWVYRRAGLPCRRCHERVAARVDGGEQRRTYWCPRCQPDL